MSARCPLAVNTRCLGLGRAAREGPHRWSCGPAPPPCVRGRAGLVGSVGTRGPESARFCGLHCPVASEGDFHCHLSLFLWQGAAITREAAGSLGDGRVPVCTTNTPDVGSLARLAPGAHVCRVGAAPSGFPARLCVWPVQGTATASLPGQRTLREAGRGRAGRTAGLRRRLQLGRSTRAGARAWCQGGCGHAAPRVSTRACVPSPHLLGP